MTKPTSIQETLRIMSVAEIVALCKCSQGKVSLYFSKNQIQPVAYRHEQFHNVKLYELTNELERYFKTVHKTGPIPKKEKNMVTLHTQKPTPPKGMTIRMMADFCGCSANKVAVYIRTCGVAPSGTIKDKYHPSLNIYDFTNEDAEYLRETHRVSNARRIPDEERIASGWMTATEAAAKWGCGLSKATSLLLEAKAPYRWEGGSPYRGRKFYKIPRPPRDPQAYKAKQKDERGGDWLAGVASKEVRDMVLDERKWRGMIGRRVAVEMKQSGVKFDAVLLRYSMCWFDVRRDNGRVETYKHSEAKVVEEAE